MSTHTALRDSFRARYPSIRYGLGDWREYNAGVWEVVSELQVQNRVQTVCEDLKANTTASLVSSITTLLRSKLDIPSRLFDANPYLLTFNDCTLDLINFQSVPHSPEHYATRKLNFNYSPQAKSPAWERFLSTAPHVSFLQEFSGYCLTPETLYETAVWLHGPPAGGKSTFITGIQAMLGPKCCILGLNEVERSPFALAGLPGRTLAISTEQPSIYMKSPHLLNAIISGEPILINRKYRDHVEITPRAKLLWAMNELPRVDINGGAGIFRRVYPVYWDTRAQATRDPQLKEDIAKSGAAIVNWAIEGLKRLNTRGKFNYPSEILAERDDYRRQSDITLNFINDCCDQHPSYDVPSATLYDAYRKWSKSNGHRALASNRFASDLIRLGYEKTRREFGIIWTGLELKPDFPDLIIDDSAT